MTKPRTISYRNEAKRHLMSTAARYGWKGKTYAGAKAFARKHSAPVFKRILGVIQSIRTTGRKPKR